jgi:hypothetical protein
MARLITTESPTRDATRFLRYWASADYVVPRLRRRHPSLSAERCKAKARQVSVHVSQGLEFLESANGASLLTKPLSLFYAAENLLKAMCMFLVAAVDDRSFRHHGLSGDRTIKRYFVRNLSCRVGADGRNVWWILFRAFNADRIRYAMRHPEIGSAMRDELVVHQTSPPAVGTTLKLGTLLRHLPELAEDTEPAGLGHSFSVHAATLTFSAQPGPPNLVSGTIRLRHAYRTGVREMVMAAERGLLKGYRRAADRADILEYEIGPVEEAFQYPDLRLDVFGEPWADFGPARTRLGELVTYYAALFTLSDAVRYQADQWLRLLADHPAEAILIDRYLDVVVRKLPNLVLNELEDALFLFRFAH